MLNGQLSKMGEDILEIISAVTGHKIKDLEMDMYLEGDLGFDSIKMVTLMNELMKLIPKDQLEEFMNRNPVNSLMALDTVGDIIDVFEIWNSSKTNTVTEDNKPVEKYGYLENKNMDDEEELEILNAQYPFLASYFAVGTITICTGVKVRGKLNIDCLWDSWRELIDKHIVLKSYFRAPENAKAFKEYKLLLENSANPPKINVYDMRNLKQYEQQEAIKDKIEEIINTRFNIFKWPLHNITVIQTKDLEYEIIFSNSHLISDGLGNQQIIKELLEIYGAKISGEEYKSSGKVSLSIYNEVVTKINSWKDYEEINRLKEYLKKQGKDKYFFNPYEKNKQPHHSYAKVKSIKYWIDKDIIDRLISCTKKWRVSLFTLLVSAYLKTIKEQSEGNNIILNLPTGGKIYPNSDATGILGCFAQNLAVSFNLDGNDRNWETLIKTADMEIKNAI